MRGTPGVAPFAGIAGIGVIGAIGIVALNVGKIEKNLAVGGAVRPNLVVASIKIAVGSAAVQMAGHVDESNIRIILLKLVDGIEICVESFLGVVRTAAAP